MTETRNFADRAEADDRQTFLLGRVMALSDAICALAEDGELKASRMSLTYLGPFIQHPAEHYERVSRFADERFDAARRRDPVLADSLHAALESVRARIEMPIAQVVTYEDESAIVAGWDQQHYRIVERRLSIAQAERERAMEYAKSWARELHATGMSEVQIAEKLGINRQTVRSALGKG